MFPTTTLLCTLFLTSAAFGRPKTWEKRASSNFRGTCDQIAKAVSDASQVFFPPSTQYLSDIFHFAPSSTQESACSVEPGTAEDVSKILRILGSTRTPFAVKGGGHSTNLGFSSTKGVQIALARFNDTNVNSDDGTVEVGPGLTWDQVYTTLNSTGVNVVGGRVPGVGVAGFTLGGGYSYKSSQYGLAIDNVASYELVLPNGTITTVTSHDKDLWFGLRGGLNNFGVVTKFVLKSHPQAQIWAGLIFYTGTQLDAIKEAYAKFQQANDTKASLLISLVYSSGQFTIFLFAFYDAPTPPPGLFDGFLAIPSTQNTVSTRSFSDFVESLNSLAASGAQRSLYSGIPATRYSPAIFDALKNMTVFWGTRLEALDKNASVVTSLEPFDSTLLSHGTPSAYPPDRSQVVFPGIVSFQWYNASLDATMARALRQNTDEARAAVLADGQDVSHAATYVNYALFDTPLKDMYGANVPRLRKLRAEIDPEDVMGLAGGFKF
ncbi:FAD-binding domain-containing protein [Lactarius akahatsu]|uniref:FAD-binding domain-containing protein n=1 Tax=Lactarius akahatsu TaxID=416441 RepID=A0AAD4LQ60_9AGAM|nr:FAD-binding domain-containing protein [Lactarius akahatsu]